MKQYIAELEARVEKLDKVKVTKELVSKYVCNFVHPSYNL